MCEKCYGEKVVYHFENGVATIKPCGKCFDRNTAVKKFGDLYDKIMTEIEVLENGKNSHVD